MSNKVTKEMLDESLASIQDYLDNTSAEDILKVMTEIGGFTEGGILAAEIIGWEPEEIMEYQRGITIRNDTSYEELVSGLPTIEEARAKRDTGGEDYA